MDPEPKRWAEEQGHPLRARSTQSMELLRNTAEQLAQTGLREVCGGSPGLRAAVGGWRYAALHVFLGVMSHSVQSQEMLCIGKVY